MSENKGSYIAIGSVLGLIFLLVANREIKLSKQLSVQAKKGALNKPPTIKEVDLTINIEVANPADIPINILPGTLPVYFNNAPVGLVNITDSIVYGHSYTDIPVALVFDPTNLILQGLVSLNDLVLHRENILIDIQGTVRAGIKYVYTHDFPVSVTITLADLLAGI